MSSPVVIQGTAVQQPTSFGVSSGNTDYGTQPKQTSCNDPLFVVLFAIAVIGIGAVASIYAPGALADAAGSGSSTTAYAGYVVVAAVIAVLSFVGAGLGMAVLMCIPQFLIKVSLIFSVILSGIMAIYSFIAFPSPMNYIGGIMGLVFFGISICYARIAWKRIPFATANLVTAITAVKKNIGITLVAYLFTIVGVVWTILWSLAFVGVSNNVTSDATSDGSIGGVWNFLLLLALFFVQQVIQNSVHVTVAGTVATWWYAPQEAGCGTVCNSFLRTITTSLGSICMGSLLVAIIQALKAMARQAQEEGECSALACVAQCILGCIEGIVEYFNKWAFIYVGVYGMGYIQAGKSVFELFRSRGWEAVIADDLVGNALFLVSLVVGVLMGGVGAAVEATIDQIDDVSADTTTIPSTVIAFFLGFIIGLVVTSILMTTIGSAVNAVIVLFAEGPREFEQNHPELSRKMREVWASTYPGSI